MARPKTGEQTLRRLRRETELAEDLGLTREVIRGWQRAGLPVICIGRYRWIDLDDLDAFLAEHRQVQADAEAAA